MLTLYTYSLVIAMMMLLYLRFLEMEYKCDTRTKMVATLCIFIDYFIFL